jgi:hypothetical protein
MCTAAAVRDRHREEIGERGIGEQCRKRDDHQDGKHGRGINPDSVCRNHTHAAMKQALISDEKRNGPKIGAALLLG